MVMSYDEYKASASLDWQLEYIELFEGALRAVPGISAEDREECGQEVREGEIDSALAYLVELASANGLDVRPLVRYLYSVWEEVEPWVLDIAAVISEDQAKERDARANIDSQEDQVGIREKKS